MRAIVIQEKTLREIEIICGKKVLKEARAALALADELEIRIYYIPEYVYPEAEGMTRKRFVTGEYLFKHFHVGVAFDWENWFIITPRKTA